MIQRVFDPAILNHFANHSDIRPHVGGSGYLDLTPAVREPNVFLFGKYGGFAYCWTGPGVFEVHTMIVPNGRGAWAFEAAKQSIAWMADNGADHIWTRVHPDARHTAIFTRKSGLKEAGTHTLDLGDGPVAWRIFDWRKPCQY